MTKKIRASLLGQDINLLKNVAKRVVQNRPAEVKYFTEVKEFLMDSMNDKPDIVAISVNCSHKNAEQFPKVFKMALNIPVIAFGENQETKTRKSLSNTNADYKIAGVLTAHNFWMKLVNHQKKEESEAESERQKVKNSGITEDKGELSSESIQVADKIKVTNHVKEKNGAINKGEFEKILDQDENSIIDSLFAQIDNQNNKISHTAQDTSELSLKDKKSNISEISTTPVENKLTEESAISAESKKPVVPTIKKGPSFEHIHGDKKQKLSSAYNPSQSQSMKGQVKPMVANAGIFSGEGLGDDMALGPKKKESKPKLAAAKENEGKPKLASVKEGGFFSGEGLSDDSAAGPKQKESENKPKLAIEKEKSAPFGTGNKTKTEDGVKAPNMDEKGRVKLTDKKELQKREQEKYKEKKKKEFGKVQNILQDCCQAATKTVFYTKSLDQPREFAATSTFVFTIELDGFKGFLLVAESFNQGFEKSTLESFRSSLIDLIKSKGYIAELSSPYLITVPESNYSEVVNESCEFTVYEEEDTGKQIAISYLQREVTLPQYEDSDKEGMIMVDMKTIPPKTPVNFDAFIYLERNKRFVRYLKEGRSLSLKQVKRHIEEEVPCKLYLPKNDKAKLIQFFIQNTISWEFLSHSAEIKEPA